MKTIINKLNLIILFCGISFIFLGINSGVIDLNTGTGDINLGVSKSGSRLGYYHNQNKNNSLDLTTTYDTNLKSSHVDNHCATNSDRSMRINPIRNPEIINITNNPQNMTYNNILYHESTNFIFISEYDKNDVIRCNSNNNQLYNCSTVIGNLDGPENIAIYKDKLYILNLNSSSIVICSLDSIGDINACDIKRLQINNPVYLLIDKNRLYISNFGANSTSICDLDDNGNLVTCKNSYVNSKLFKSLYDNDFIYYVDSLSNTIKKCDNDYNSCILMQDSTFNLPLTLSIIGRVAYISNYNTNSVSSCKIDASGLFYDCSDVLTNLFFPIGIAGYSVSKT